MVLPIKNGTVFAQGSIKTPALLAALGFLKIMSFLAGVAPGGEHAVHPP